MYKLLVSGAIIVFGFTACSSNPRVLSTSELCGRYRIKAEKLACLKDHARLQGAHSGSVNQSPPDKETRTLGYDR